MLLKIFLYVYMLLISTEGVEYLWSYVPQFFSTFLWLQLQQYLSNFDFSSRPDFNRQTPSPLAPSK